MMLRLYAIHDRKIDCFLSPACYKNEGECLRAIKFFVSERVPLMKEFPEDYSLHEVGQFDDARGIVNGYEVPKFVCEVKWLIGEEDDGNGGVCGSSEKTS